jgi:hypothetical protein
MPGLNSLADDYLKNQNVVFIAVAHNAKDEGVYFFKKEASGTGTESMIKFHLTILARDTLRI